MKFWLQVVSDLLNKSHLIIKGDFLRLKLSNYALKLRNRKNLSLITKKIKFTNLYL